MSFYTSYLDACILVTSKNPDNKRFGTGFIVIHAEKKSYVVTCAHVISDVGGGDSIEADGQPARIVSIGSADGLDLAVIEVDELFGRPVVQLKVLSAAGSPFLTIGFRSFGRHLSIAPLYGTAEAIVALESRKYGHRVKAWNLAIRDGAYLHDGYSGSPVIDDDGFCVGVITYKQGDGKIGLAISIEELEIIWDTMPIGLIEKKSEYHSYCDRLASQATRLYITGDLAQALDIYQQIRVAEPSYPRINIMIRSVEAEMERPYIDNYGRVRANDVLLSPHEESHPAAYSDLVHIWVKAIILGFIITTIFLLFKFNLFFSVASFTRANWRHLVAVIVIILALIVIKKLELAEKIYINLISFAIAFRSKKISKNDSNSYDLRQTPVEVKSIIVDTNINNNSKDIVNILASSQDVNNFSRNSRVEERVEKMRQFVRYNPCLSESQKAQAFDALENLIRIYIEANLDARDNVHAEIAKLQEIIASGSSVEAGMKLINLISIALFEIL